MRGMSPGLHIKTTVDSKVIRARNVVGVLPGKDTSEIIVIGGHYDHLACMTAGSGKGPTIMLQERLA